MELTQIFAADCIKVDGYLRSCIYDLTRQQYFLFKKFDTLNELEGEILNFLIDEDVVLQIPTVVKEQFKEIELEYTNNQLIAVCQIYYFKYFDLTNLTDLYCRDFVFIIEGEIQKKLEIINQHLENLINLPINSVEIILQNCLVNDEILNSINNIVENFNFCKAYILESVFCDFNLKLSTNVILRCNSLIQKEMNDFHINITAFTESQKFNLFYNQFLIIDDKGNIKNSLYNQYHFGSISEMNHTELKKIVFSTDFSYLMTVPKNNINVCMDCEFKHMCCDDKLPLKRGENDWYHKDECHYNPYIAKWSNEKGYKNLAECGVISNEHEFSIDHEKIAQINKELWGDE